ncbi:hypothetical protein [Liberiplasma polymorphum]|uniref:hypothetical protein n=1 Tax=Liberiplasma polymorphum TaxID=3374570 RepID=UPI003775BED7
MSHIDLTKWKEALKDYHSHNMNSSIIEQFNNFKEDAKKEYYPELNDIVFQVLEVAKHKKDHFIAGKVLTWALKNVDGAHYSTFKTSVESFCSSDVFAPLIDSEHIYKIIVEDIKNNNDDLVEHMNIIVSLAETTQSLKEVNELIKKLKSRNEYVDKKSVNKLFAKLRDSRLNTIGETNDKHTIKFNQLVKNHQGRRQRIKFIKTIGTFASGFVLAVTLIYQFLVLDIEVKATNEVIQIVYLDEVPTNDFQIIHKMILRDKEIDITEDMFLFDENFIGTQTAYIRYKNKQIPFTLIILPLQLKQPEFTINQQQLHMHNAGIEVDYQVKINDDIFDIETSVFDLSFLTEGTHEISVKAVALSEKYINSEFSESITATKLNDFNEIVYDQDRLQWNPIVGASYYIVSINNKQFETTDLTLNYDLNRRVNHIKIQAVSTEEFMISNTQYEFEIIKLNTVSNLIYTNYRLSWTSDETNYKFQIIINDVSYETLDNFLDIELEIGIHEIEIITFDPQDQAISSDVYSKSLHFTKLETPNYYLLEGNNQEEIILAIENVENADVFEILVKKFVNLIDYIEQIYLHDNSTFFTLPTDNYMKFEIRVISKNTLFEHQPSNVGDVLTIHKLQTPSNVDYTNNQLTWEDIAFATGYNIWINEDFYTSKINALTVTLPSGSNTIRIQATGEYLNTIKSNIYETNLNRLSGVSNIAYVSNQLVWESSETEHTFVITINGEVYQTTNYFLNLTLEVGVHDVTIQVVDLDGIYIASSLVQVQIGFEKLVDPVITLSSGTTSTMYQVTIDEVLNATVYQLTIEIYNNDVLEWENTIELRDTYSYTFFASNESTDIVVKVTAIDENGQYANSNLIRKGYEIE